MFDELLEPLVLVSESPHFTAEVIVFSAELLDVCLSSLHFGVDLDGSQPELFVLVEHTARGALVKLSVGFDPRIFLPGPQHGDDDSRNPRGWDPFTAPPSRRRVFDVFKSYSSLADDMTARFGHFSHT